MQATPAREKNPKSSPEQRPYMVTLLPARRAAEARGKKRKGGEGAAGKGRPRKGKETSHRRRTQPTAHANHTHAHARMTVFWYKKSARHYLLA